MAESSGISRRGFLQVAAGVGGGLVAGWYLPGFGRGALAAPVEPSQALQPNAFVRITPDNWVTVIVGHSELGQGALTALPMLVAEELDADWNRVRWEQAPAAPAYAHPIFKTQVTGASLTTPAQYEPQRQAGAAVREMLVTAAARRWGVDPSSLRTESSRVIHSASNQSATYGELASEAVGMPVPDKPRLKDPKDFKIIGKSLPRLDGPAKVDGSAKFGLDVYVPNMLTALIARPPIFRGKARGFDATKAKAVPGVVGVYAVPSGVAIVAKDFWSAKQGRDALVIDWDPVAGERVSSEDQRVAYEKLMGIPGTTARRDGDVAAADKGATRRLTADFQFPYLAHATMEPLNAVVDLGDDSCEIWVGTQWQGGDQLAAATTAGLKPEQVKVNTMFLGGGFGRRTYPALIVEAVEVAKAARAPVKLVWTREDDIKGGSYRPAARCRLTATLDAAGRVTSWTDRIAVQSVSAGTAFEPVLVKDGVDSQAVEGAQELPYAIPNVLIDLHTTRYNVPVWWWRSVGHSFNAFAVESFIDELAHAAGADPYQFRRDLLKAKPRHLGVLDAVAQASGWSGKPLTGVHRGIAVHESYGSFVANVAEISVGANKELVIHRIVCAVDCGVAVNPDLVKAQMESGIIFGLSAALLGEITLKDGVVEQSNFDDYPVLRMYQTSKIEVHIVESHERPSGVGEPGVPCVGPALANAIFAATGERIRSLPLKKHHALHIA
jgi:isoquinoline 1-oxidoreductase subunit beta